MVASAVGGTSCSSAPEATRTAAEPIIGGDADVADVAVVALQQTSTGTLCSGTLIAPTVVLTAAHCVYGVEASDLQVLVGDDVTSPTLTIAVTSVVTYPTYTGESTGLAGGVDLGVVTLAQALSVTPVALDATATDAELADATVTLVGFGVSSTTDDNLVGVRRSVSTPITAVCSRILTLGDASANECFGDSGGAVLLAGKLVAVISSGLPDCTAPSSQTRLSAHATWLADVLAGTPSAACPACVPPESVLRRCDRDGTGDVGGRSDGRGRGGRRPPPGVDLALARGMRHDAVRAERRRRRSDGPRRAAPRPGPGPAETRLDSASRPPRRRAGRSPRGSPR